MWVMLPLPALAKPGTDCAPSGEPLKFIVLSKKKIIKKNKKKIKKYNVLIYKRKFGSNIKMLLFTAFRYFKLSYQSNILSTRFQKV
jgi:hypothetical protein